MASNELTSATTAETQYFCPCGRVHVEELDRVSLCWECLLYFRTDDNECPGCGGPAEDCDELSDDAGICPDCGDVAVLEGVDRCCACAAWQVEGVACPACGAP